MMSGKTIDEINIIKIGVMTKKARCLMQRDPKTLARKIMKKWGVRATR